MKVHAPINFSDELQLSNSRTKNKILLDEALKRAAHLLAENYIWVIIIVGGVFITFETIEHIIFERESALFYLVEIFLIVLLLTITAFLTRMLMNSLAEGSQAVRILRFRNNLGVLLSSCQDIAEMSRKLIQQMAVVAPSANIELYLYEKNINWFTPAEDMSENAVASKRYRVPGMDPYLCLRCMATAQNHSVLRPFRDCMQSQGKDGYCLPLVQNISPVGLLRLSAPAHKDFDAEQKLIFENVSKQMAVYLDSAIVKKEREAEIITQKTRAVQLDIARDLHDTIGQNISYLRMKLDLLSETDLRGKPNLDAEIRHMFEVANESYDLVRGTLAILQSGSSADLLHLFRRYGEQVAERSAFEFHCTGQGEPRSLSPHRMRQLFYIFREALCNVEKHARASQVYVELTWEENNLALVIADNGCGFDPARNDFSGHYGLRFLRDRTDNIGGSLSIYSSLGVGTRVVVHAPCG